jgi:hypothetical protein
MPTRDPVWIAVYVKPRSCHCLSDDMKAANAQSCLYSQATCFVVCNRLAPCPC